MDHKAFRETVSWRNCESGTEDGKNGQSLSVCMAFLHLHNIFQAGIFNCDVCDPLFIFRCYSKLTFYTCISECMFKVHVNWKLIS